MYHEFGVARERIRMLLFILECRVRDEGKKFLPTAAIAYEILRQMLAAAAHHAPHSRDDLTR